MVVGPVALRPPRAPANKRYHFSFMARIRPAAWGRGSFWVNGMGEGLHCHLEFRSGRSVTAPVFYIDPTLWRIQVARGWGEPVPGGCE